MAFSPENQTRFHTEVRTVHSSQLYSQLPQTVSGPDVLMGCDSGMKRDTLLIHVTTWTNSGKGARTNRLQPYNSIHGHQSCAHSPVLFVCHFTVVMYVPHDSSHMASGRSEAVGTAWQGCKGDRTPLPDGRGTLTDARF